MKAAIAEVPEVLDENPQEEEQRAACIRRVRALIARRWNEVDKVWMHWKRPALEDFITRVKGFLEELIIIYGDHIPFAPMPPDPFLEDIMNDIDRLNGEKANGGQIVASSSKSTTSSGSSSVTIPHEFRFLVNAKSVWTVLKALYTEKHTWVFSEMSFPRIGRLVHSDGGPLLIQFISDACVSSR